MLRQFGVQIANLIMDARTEASTGWPIPLLDALLRIELGTHHAIGSQKDGAANSMGRMEERRQHPESGTVFKSSEHSSPFDLIEGIADV
eukprot:8350269-Karenia_brevis.AAC.1